MASLLEAEDWHAKKLRESGPGRRFPRQRTRVQAKWVKKGSSCPGDGTYISPDGYSKRNRDNLKIIKEIAKCGDASS